MANIFPPLTENMFQCKIHLNTQTEKLCKNQPFRDQLSINAELLE